MMTNTDITPNPLCLRFWRCKNDGSVCALADCKVTRGQVSGWLKKDDDPAHQPCSDVELARVGVHLGKHELSAFFRKPGHQHYRDCGESGPAQLSCRNAAKLSTISSTPGCRQITPGG
ncbi:MAG TPA: DUF1456 family protein [Mariprofundaceae bacterium]|nr:DUF1456 family protein [Mariprofundaceae bacterium]